MRERFYRLRPVSRWLWRFRGWRPSSLTADELVQAKTNGERLGRWLRMQ